MLKNPVLSSEKSSFTERKGSLSQPFASSPDQLEENNIALHLIAMAVAIKGFVSAESSSATGMSAWKTPPGAPLSPFSSVSVPSTAIPGVTG